ncbi:MAG TPA: NrsF family protein [Rhodanobacteraceae bacterium]|nr:NrsF family protein [Rhodanobacteraceae bacterium]
MTNPHSIDNLITALGAEMQPVRRLLPPWLRTLGWLAVVAAIAVLLFAFHGATPMLQRWAGAPDLAWATLGAVLTAIGAAWAAFTLAVPGRSRAWAWLPLPGALLWLGASGWGCFRTDFQHLIAPGTQIGNLYQTSDCLVFIIGFSIPLSALMIWLLRRACPLRPVLTAVLLGLASAAASACLLQIFHEYDTAATDLLTHALAVAVVIALNVALSGRLLSKA